MKYLCIWFRSTFSSVHFIGTFCLAVDCRGSHLGCFGDGLVVDHNSQGQLLSYISYHRCPQTSECSSVAYAAVTINCDHNALRRFPPINNMASTGRDLDEQAVLFLLMRRRRRRLAAAGYKHVWERSWIRRREGRGVYGTLLCELDAEDPEMFRRYHRVDGIIPNNSCHGEPAHPKGGHEYACRHHSWSKTLQHCDFWQLVCISESFIIIIIINFISCCVNWMQRTRRCFGGTTALTESFRTILAMVNLHIQKVDTNMRVSITPGQRLSATLRFLATGMHFV